MWTKKTVIRLWGSQADLSHHLADMSEGTLSHVVAHILYQVENTKHVTK